MGEGEDRGGGRGGGGGGGGGGEGGGGIEARRVMWTMMVAKREMREEGEEMNDRW